MKTITTLFLVFFSLCCINSVSAQWVEQYDYPGSSYSTYIFFLNDNTGWSCGTDGQFMKTTNGGTGWINYDSPSLGRIHSVKFFDVNTGCLTANTGIYRTVNSGVNWTQVNSGSWVDGYFINSQTGWASVVSGLYKTTNEGLSWNYMFTADKPINKIFFLNSSTGWICGLNEMIMKTTDGGNNWTSQNSGGTYPLNYISFSDANNGRACGYGKFFSTSNGGQNWIEHSPYSANLESGYFINASTGWIVGQNATFFTTNNGSSWVQQLNMFVWLEGVTCTSPTACYLSGEQIYKSTTGGFNLNAPINLTLTPVSTSQINLSWTDISDEDKFMIERSPNGSSGWTLIDSVNAGVTTYQNTGLTTNDDYYYRVYAKKIIFKGGYSNTANDRPLMVSPAHVSPANNSISRSLTPTLSWSPVSGSVQYFLQVASDSNFSNIVYSNSGFGSYNSQTIPAGTLQNSAKYYWHTKVRNLSNESIYSNFWSFTVQDSNYGHNMQIGNNLYYFANSTPGASLSPSKPTYNWRDTTGSISLILNRTIQVSPGDGNTDDARFDLIGKLPAGHSIRFFGTNYQNLYVGTNGIIAFTPFDPIASTNLRPFSGLPQGFLTEAIFPNWGDLDFADSDVPVNRFCYKVTSDEIIITYFRAPRRSASATEYVTFQVIISHSASPAANSQILMQYNYDETGSGYITRYNNNTLTGNLIGIQGTNSSAQCFQYRYLNISSQLITPGPMFSSNLAVQFGPNSALLPVELSSFTSQVNGSSVKLSWSTVNELNNSGFDIERRISGSNEWKKISFVQGNGTTNEAKNYSYEDKNITSGKYQYRLKQIDFNGNYEYHALANEVEIGVPKKFNLSQNYPNPFNPATKINYELPITNYVSIKIYDVNGKEVMQLVNQNQNAGYYSIEFNGANLSSGMYFYRIEAGEFTAVKKMMLIK